LLGEGQEELEGEEGGNDGRAAGGLGDFVAADAVGLVDDLRWGG
jgi:hypothetical protein